MVNDIVICFIFVELIKIAYCMFLMDFLFGMRG